MKNFFYIVIIFFYIHALAANEVKIIYKIENEIITNIDIKNEFMYLSALNNGLQDLDEEKIFNISRDSIIKEKIKKIEILKNFKNLDVNNDYLNKVIKNIYLQLELKSFDEFNNYLDGYGLTLSDIEKKISIDALWNQLIIKKYSSKIDVNIDKIENELDSIDRVIIKSYFLSEIVFEIKNKEEIEKIYSEIKKSINEKGFENTASIYSIADSAKVGGSIGWVIDQSLNKNIRDSIASLKVGDITKPFIIPGGVFFLKINDIKEEKKEIDRELELLDAINFEKDKQLNQYSKIYFNKIKKNLELNE
jgi:peptidyl-prolyl cis-trans isomerase SurA|tara:strand:+ start:352 stop:1269 length:918 start_codon:yes stop_codon:yes gene_type:complete